MSSQSQAPLDTIVPAQPFQGLSTPLAAPSLQGWPVTHIPAPAPVRDVVMTDSTPIRPESPATLPGATTGSSNAPSPAPARTSTPSRNASGNGNDVNPRTNSQHLDQVPAMPKEAPPHGAPTRRFLNENVTGVLLDGMKMIAKERPENPLQALGEYLIERSKDIERP